MKTFNVIALLLIGSLLVVFAQAERVARPQPRNVVDGAANVELPKEELVEDEEDDLPCPCPRILDPVCASDKHNYANRCEFNCAQKKMARRGRKLAINHGGYC